MHDTLKTALVTTLIVATSIAGCAVVSTMTYNDAVAAEERYCEMTKAQAWGNYRPEINCDGE